MNTNLLAIVKRIITENGETILTDPPRVKAFFSDLAKDEPKPLRMAFGRGLEAGAYTALKTAPDAGERALRKGAIAQRLRDEHGLDINLCAEALDVLEAALFGDKQPPVLCKSCGRELQEGWKACPYCGAACGAAEPPPAAAPAVQVTPSKPAASSAPPELAKLQHTLRNALIAAGVVAVIAVVWNMSANTAPPPVPAMVRVEGGTFMMGSPANEPERGNNEVQHQVTVSGFFMGKYEVTQKEWQEVMGNNPSNWKGDNLPVENVSWYDAVEYCNKRSQLEGLTPAYTINKTRRDPQNTNEYSDIKWLITWNRRANGYRLPTEAEWEYACRAGTSSPFNTGSNITTSEANYNGNYPYNNNAKGVYREKTVEVGSFAANGWGLYDMHGNVNEWCWDWYGDYASGSQSDPAGPYTGANRVIRGGSWYFYARDLRSADRSFNTFSDWIIDAGFRLVRSR